MYAESGLNSIRTWREGRKLKAQSPTLKGSSRIQSSKPRRAAVEARLETWLWCLKRPMNRNADFSPQGPGTDPRASSRRWRPTSPRSGGLKSACRVRFMAGEQVRMEQGASARAGRHPQRPWMGRRRRTHRCYSVPASAGFPAHRRPRGVTAFTRALNRGGGAPVARRVGPGLGRCDLDPRMRCSPESRQRRIRAGPPDGWRFRGIEPPAAFPNATQNSRTTST